MERLRNFGRIKLGLRYSGRIKEGQRKDNRRTVKGLTLGTEDYEG